MSMKFLFRKYYKTYVKLWESLPVMWIIHCNCTSTNRFKLNGIMLFVSIPNQKNVQHFYFYYDSKWYIFSLCNFFFFQKVSPPLPPPPSSNMGGQRYEFQMPNSAPPPPQFTDQLDDSTDQPIIPIDEDPYAATGPDLTEPSWIPSSYIEKGGLIWYWNHH